MEANVPYTITFWHKQYVSQTGKETTTSETAADALKTYWSLVQSDETVEISDPNGRQITGQMLEILAKQDGS